MLQLARRGQHHAAAFIKAQPLYWREAMLCVPAVPCLLVAGFWSRHIAYGAVAAGAAFAVGFGAARDLRGRRWGAMIAAVIGVTVAALIGSLCGERPVLQASVSAVAAAACASLALVNEDLWWVSMQMVIALLVGGYFAGPSVNLARSTMVFVGGTVQVGFVVVLARLAPRAAGRLPAGSPRPAPSNGLLIAHSARAAICVGLSLEAARALNLANNYWAPMTAMLVLKPGLNETRSRGAARLTGTIAGCLLAASFAFSAGYERTWLVGGVAASAGAAYALQKAHYAMLTCAITSTVVLLLSAAQSGGALVNAEHRLAATALGGAIALLVAFVIPHRTPASVQPSDHVAG